MARTDNSPRRRLPGAVRRREILDAAETAFMAASYDQVSLVSIARAADASDALVVRHFETKANLYLAVWERRLDELLAAQAAADAAHAPEATALERLVTGLHAYLDFVAGRPRAWAQQFLAPDGEPAGAGELRLRWRRRFAEQIRERGDLPDRPLVHTALAGFIGLSEALCFEWVQDGCRDDQRAAIVSMSVAALRSLVAEAERSGDRPG